MEGFMVNKWTSDNNTMVKDFFKVNFPEFILNEEISHGPNWGVRYTKDNEIEVRIEGDIGFGITIRIDDEQLDLWRFDKTVMKHQKTSSENIDFQLSVLKKFLE